MGGRLGVSAGFVTRFGFQYPGEGPQLVRYIFGTCSGFGTTTQDVWETDGIKIYPSAPGLGSVVSTSADDNVSGVGARKVLVHGLDANFKEVTELVDMNGLTPVPTVTTWIRIFKLIIVDLGSALREQGIITCDVGGDIQSRIIPRLDLDDPVGSSLETHYTIPAGKTGYISQWNVTQWNGELSMGLPGRPNNQEVHLQIRLNNDATLNNPPWHTLDVHHSANTGGHRPFAIPRTLPEKTDIVVRARAVDTVEVAASYEIVLVDTPVPTLVLP